MRYDIRNQLVTRDGQVTVEIDAPAPPGTDAEFAGNVTGRITLRNVGGEIAAWGRLQATVLMKCARCLEVHEVPLSFDFTESCAFEQIDEPLAYTQIADDEEPSTIPILDGEVVDLSELVRQLLVLHVPARSVCRADCPGLCSHCGARLASSSCECEQETIDPRLAPLRKLLQ